MGRKAVLTPEERKARQKTYLRAYWEKNKDRLKKKRKENYNPDYYREYQHKNRDKINAYMREYRKRRREVEND